MTSTPNGPRPGGRSRWADLGGPVRYLDFGGPADGPAIVCVHGLGGSAVNWWAIAPLLTDRYRVLAPGPGRARAHPVPGPRHRRGSSNRALLHRFIEEMTAGPVILMGNSMGGMISMLEAVAAPSSVAGLILLDPAVPVVPARPDPFVAAMFALYVTPGVGRLMMDRRRHQAPETIVANIMSLVCADPARVPADAVAQHVEVARQRAAFPGINRDYARGHPVRGRHRRPQPVLPTRDPLDQLPGSGGARRPRPAGAARGGPRGGARQPVLVPGRAVRGRACTSAGGACRTPPG